MIKTVLEEMAYYNMKIAAALTQPPDEALSMLFEEYRLAGPGQAALAAALIGQLCARQATIAGEPLALGNA